MTGSRVLGGFTVSFFPQKLSEDDMVFLESLSRKKLQRAAPRLAQWVHGIVTEERARREGVQRGHYIEAMPAWIPLRSWSGQELGEALVAMSAVLGGLKEPRPTVHQFLTRTLLTLSAWTAWRLDH